METLINFISIEYLLTIVSLSYAAKTWMEETDKKPKFSFYYVVLLVGIAGGIVYHFMNDMPLYKVIITFGMATGFYKLLFQWWLDWLKNFFKNQIKGDDEKTSSDIG